MLTVLRTADVAAAASQAVAIGASANTLRASVVDEPVVGASVVYLKFGDSTVTAAAGDFAVLSGTSDVVAVPGNATHVAVFADTETIVNLAFGNRV
jgi:hypothetical protein